MILVLTHMPELTAKENRPLKGIKVLVVDDSQDLIDLFEIQLSEAGADVMCALSGGEAFAKYSENFLDVIVSDICMPGMDGYEFIETMRKSAGNQKTPAIGVTGWKLELLKAQSKPDCFDLMLMKPIPRSQLVSEVARLAGRKKLGT